jgi:hypothetical protein
MNTDKDAKSIPKVQIGRGGGIRIHDLLVPNEARYQTALRPDCIGLPGDQGGFFGFFSGLQVDF